MTQRITTTMAEAAPDTTNKGKGGKPGKQWVEPIEKRIPDKPRSSQGQHKPEPFVRPGYLIYVC